MEARSLWTARVCCVVSRSRRRTAFAPKPPVRSRVSTVRPLPIPPSNDKKVSCVACERLSISDKDYITAYSSQGGPSIPPEDLLASLDLLPVNPFWYGIDFVPQLADLLIGLCVLLHQKVQVPVLLLVLWLDCFFDVLAGTNRGWGYYLVQLVDSLGGNVVKGIYEGMQVFRRLVIGSPLELVSVDILIIWVFGEEPHTVVRVFRF
jgi:hypothetical protein